MEPNLNDMISHLSPWELVILKWHLQRHPHQTPPKGELPYIWLLLGGRGAGKTQCGSNHILETALNLPRTSENKEVRIALVGHTYDDVKKTMVEGKSGILGILPKEYDPRYNKAVGKWNRTIGELTIAIPLDDKYTRTLIFSSYTSGVPEKLRGPQFHLGWVDEFAKFEDADQNPMDAGTTWSNLHMCMRLGPKPHVIVTGTPTPCRLTQYFQNHEDCAISKASTWANRENLPDSYVKELERLDPNSRVARQEIYAEVLLDTPNALFDDQDIQRAKYIELPKDVQVFKVLGFDPSMSSSDDSDEAGIILTGYVPETKIKNPQGGRPVIDEHAQAYVLQDFSGHHTPAEQAEIVIKTVLKEDVGDLVVEVNQGADYVVTLLTQALKDQTQDFTIRKHRKARTTDWGSIKRYSVKAWLDDGTTHDFMISAISAMRSKKVRAETASYQMAVGRIHFPKDPPLPVCSKESCHTSLTYEATTWDPTKTSHRYRSPNRLDAFVYTILFIFGRHALYSEANARLRTPVASKEPTSMSEDQRNLREKKTAVATIYSLDLGGRGRANPEDPLNRRIY